MNRRLRLALYSLAAIFLAVSAFAQDAVLQVGPTAQGHVPVYAGPGYSQPLVLDGGGSGGQTQQGVGLSEFGVTSQSQAGTYPVINGGNGPNGEHGCLYDAPVTNATGYHYICLEPNAQGGGLLSFGSGGAATALPLHFIINGITYSFPFNSALFPATSVLLGGLYAATAPSGQVVTGLGNGTGNLIFTSLNSILGGAGAVLKSKFLTQVSAQATNGLTGFLQFIPAGPDNPVAIELQYGVTAVSGDALCNEFLTYAQASTSANPAGLGLSSGAANTLLAAILAASN